jgi:mRNA interferase RelE/StbE
VSCNYKIEYSKESTKQLKSLDRATANKIIQWLEDRILSGANPRLWGKQLKGTKFGDLWRYRVGNYRVLCLIKDNIVTVEVVAIGHRKYIYD